MGLLGPAAKAQQATSADWFDRAIVIDALSGISDPSAPPGSRRISESWWNDLASTGVTLVSMTIEPVGNKKDGWANYLAGMVTLKQALAEYRGRLMLVRDTADIVRAKREGRMAITLNSQDTAMVGTEIDRLALMRRDGVLTIQLTYNNRNLSGDGALEPSDAGLSKLGRATIEAIEANRQLLDLSHGGRRTMAEAAAMATRPLAITHTGMRAIHDHVRNTDDETARMVARKGGVVGIYLMPFLHASMKPSGEHLMAHFDHALRVVGEDHIGIGSDNGLAPIVLTPERRQRLRAWQAERARLGIASPGEGPDFVPIVSDYNSLDRYKQLSHDLQKRGWPARRVEKLLGGNFQRLYREAWGA